MNKKEERDEKIKENVDKIVKSGVKTKIAIRVVAEKYYLHETTVRDIIYRNKKE